MTRLMYAELSQCQTCWHWLRTSPWQAPCNSCMYNFRPYLTEIPALSNNYKQERDQHE